MKFWKHAMHKLILFLLSFCFVMFAYAERYDIYVHEQAKPNNAPLMESNSIDLNSLSSSFEEGQHIRSAWDKRKARKKHEQAMQELSILNLKDNDAVMTFARKYPNEIDKLKELSLLQKQLVN